MKKMLQHLKPLHFYNGTDKKHWLIIPVDWNAFSAILSREYDKA